MVSTLLPQFAVAKIHALIIEVVPAEEHDLEEWIEYIVDGADVIGNEEDFIDKGVFDSAGWYAYIYPQVKQVILNKLNYHMADWLAASQPIIE